VDAPGTAACDPEIPGRDHVLKENSVEEFQKNHAEVPGTQENLKGSLGKGEKKKHTCVREVIQAKAEGRGKERAR